jgi:small basic protein
MKIALVSFGLLIGSVVGFLVRPAVPFMGQLSFSTVITRGTNLHGLDQLLVGYARTSFNYLIAGTIAGAVLGLITSFVIPSRR